MNTLPIAVQGRRRRRRHSTEFKASVIQACLQPGVSVASVALANGLNANMLRKWVIEAERARSLDGRAPSIPASQTVDATPAFIPLELPGPASVADIRIELKRAGTTVSVTWPISAAAECAAWLRELLR